MRARARNRTGLPPTMVQSGSLREGCAQFPGIEGLAPLEAVPNNAKLALKKEDRPLEIEPPLPVDLFCTTMDFRI